MKAENYEISDTLWGRVTDYTSAVLESWGKDVDEYVEDFFCYNNRKKLYEEVK